MRAGKYQEARAELESALKRGLSHKRELRLGMADLGLETNNLSEAREYSERVMQRYPGWFAGYQEMGEALVMGEKFKEGIPYLLKANRIQEAWPSYRTLAIAYFYTNQDGRAIAAIDKAIGLNRALLADPQLMVLTAKAYMKVGKPKVARGALITLANNDPAVKSDPTFIKLYHDVESALQGH